MSGKTRRHRMLLVGPWRSDTAAGGCCSVDTVRALRVAVTEEVVIELVDLRNASYLLPTVYSDTRRAGFSMLNAARQAIRATTPWTLVVDVVVRSRAESLTAPSALRYLPEEFRY